MPTYNNPGVIEFDGAIRASGGSAFIEFPHSVEELFGVKGRVPMVATFDGVETYRGSLVKMGGDCHLVSILKEIRERLGKDDGEKVHVTVRLDDTPRVVTLPDDAAAALAARPDAKSFYDALAFTHQREYVQWIEDAKRPETRLRRIEAMIEMLRQGKKERP